MPDILAPAKINLCLRVGRRRPDGYHPVCTLMEQVNLHDRLHISKNESGVSVTGAEIPVGANSVDRAMAALTGETGVPLPVGIELEKRIPVAAGLAGGSSDAAATLMALVDMFSLAIEAERLAAVALEIGADVPFFLSPGPRLATGIGERLEAAAGLPSYFLVLVTPDGELSTADVYREFDRGAGGSDESMEEIAGRLRRRMVAGLDLPKLADLLVNDLEPPAMAMEPAIVTIKEELLSLGAAGSLMSGSGPSVFGLFADENRARAAAESLSSSYSRVWALEPLR